MSNVESKLDKMQESISEIKETLVRHESLHQRNTETIEHHVRRSDLTDESLQLLRDEMKPIKVWVDRAKGALWAVGIAGTVLYGLYEMGILQKLFSS